MMSKQSSIDSTLACGCAGGGSAWVREVMVIKTSGIVAVMDEVITGCSEAKPSILMGRFIQLKDEQKYEKV
jgi:hypothetical protein